jgi:hypothetical protein
LVSERGYRFSRHLSICEMNIYFRMVSTRQGARSDSSPVRGGRQIVTEDKGLEGDPLLDTTSYVPAESV